MSPASTRPSAIEVPQVDTDEPVAVIPLASVAPLDGPPDGQRINTFALARVQPRERGAAALRQQILERPLVCAVAAFALGFLFARMSR